MAGHWFARIPNEGTDSQTGNRIQNSASRGASPGGPHHLGPSRARGNRDSLAATQATPACLHRTATVNEPQPAHWRAAAPFPGCLHSEPCRVSERVRTTARPARQRVLKTECHDLRAAESEEDVWLPAPNRDCQGADILTGIFNGADYLAHRIRAFRSPPSVFTYASQNARELLWCAPGAAARIHLSSRALFHQRVRYGRTSPPLQPSRGSPTC